MNKKIFIKLGLITLPYIVSSDLLAADFSAEESNKRDVSKRVKEYDCNCICDCDCNCDCKDCGNCNCNCDCDCVSY